MSKIKNSYLIDIQTEQRFEYSKGGLRQQNTWLWVTAISGTHKVPDKEKTVLIHFSNWREYIEGTWDTVPSQQERILNRIKELRRKPKIFKWFDAEDEFKGIIKIKSWRQNHYDFVVNGILLENNLEIMEAMSKLS